MKQTSRIPKVVKLSTAKKELFTLKFKCNIYSGIFSNKSKRHFKVRPFKHLVITPLTGKKVKGPQESAAFDHVFHEGHNVSLVHPETLVKESHDFRLLFWDSILILRDNTPLKRYVKAISLGNIIFIIRFFHLIFMKHSLKVMKEEFVLLNLTR